MSSISWSPPRARTLLVAWSSVRLALLVAVAAAALVIVQSLIVAARRPTAELAADGVAAPLLLDGFYAAEQDSRGGYRWTTGAATVSLQQVGAGGPAVLGVRLGPPPAELVATAFTLGLNTESYVSIPLDGDPRRYYVLVPPAALRSGSLTAELWSETVVLPPDRRALGLRVEAATLDLIGARVVWLTPALVAAQALLLAFATLLLRRLRISLPLVAGALALLVAALAFLAGSQLLLAYSYLTRLVAALGVLTGLTFWLLPLAERRLGWLASPPLVRVVWGIGLLACAIRLSGALYPPFDAYDLPLNVNRFLHTLTGTLVMTNRSFEFGGGVTVYPPGPYIVFLPGILLDISPKVLVQGSIALVDGLGALATAALARKLGGGARAAIFSALLYAVLPINLTSLWWGHTAQVFGQALMAPLALLLLPALRRSRPWLWLAAGVVLSMALLSHIGVTILAVAWLGLAWLALGLRRLDRPTWWSFTWMLAASCFAGVTLIYSIVARMKLEQAFSVGEAVLAGGTAPAYPLIAKAFWISFGWLGSLLLLPGLLAFGWRRLGRGGAELLGGWIGAAVLFWAVEMASGLQVRYLVFLGPVACILLGMLLDRLAGRGAAGRRLAWAVVLLLLAQGSAYWFAGTFAGVAPSMVPLLR